MAVPGIPGVPMALAGHRFSLNSLRGFSQPPDLHWESQSLRDRERVTRGE